MRVKVERMVNGASEIQDLSDDLLQLPPPPFFLFLLIIDDFEKSQRSE